MEGQNSSDSPIPQSTTPIKPSLSKKDPFSMIGKIAITLIAIVLLVGGGIILGKNLNKSSESQPQTTEEKEVTPTEESTNNETMTPTEIPGPNTTQVTGGLGTDATVFKKYTLSIPQGWTSTPERSEITDKLTLTKGEYSIAIYQAPMGGSACVYPPKEPGAFEELYEEFKELTGKNGEIFRRSWDDQQGTTTTYTICQKGPEDTFQIHTIYGNMTVTAPKPADEAILTEIDSIITSIEEQ